MKFLKRIKQKLMFKYIDKVVNSDQNVAEANKELDIFKYDHKDHTQVVELKAEKLAEPLPKPDLAAEPDTAPTPAKKAGRPKSAAPKKTAPKKQSAPKK